MMITFYVLRGETKRECTAADTFKAMEILKLVFSDAKAYVLEGDNVTYFQNMSMEDARKAAGLPEPIQSMVELPPAPKPKKTTTKKPVKKPAVKKTKVKSKVVVKAKATVKKAVVKSKVKPKAKPAKKPVKGKGKKPVKAKKR